MEGSVPPWAWNLGMGAAIVAWLEVRFARKSECTLKHNAVDEALKDRREKTHELRDIVTPLVTKLALAENNLQHVTTVVESIAAKVGANGFTPRTRLKTPIPGHDE